MWVLESHFSSFPLQSPCIVQLFLHVRVYGSHSCPFLLHSDSPGLHSRGLTLTIICVWRKKSYLGHRILYECHKSVWILHSPSLLCKVFYMCLWVCHILHQVCNQNRWRILNNQIWTQMSFIHVYITIDTKANKCVTSLFGSFTVLLFSTWFSACVCGFVTFFTWSAIRIFGASLKIKLDLVLNNVKPKDRYFVLD